MHSNKYVDNKTETIMIDNYRRQQRTYRDVISLDLTHSWEIRMRCLECRSESVFHPIIADVFILYI